MKSVSNQAMRPIAGRLHQRTHRVLGSLAVAHSALLLGAIVVRHYIAPSGTNWWFESTWVGFATLWFLWPLVLLLAPGHSVRRVVVPLILSVIPGVFWLSTYLVIAPQPLGLPWGPGLSPQRLAIYFAAYRQGRNDAQRDLKAGHLAVEVYGGPGPLLPEYGYLKHLYGMEVRPVAGCDVTDDILGHARGYNQVSAAEVARRFGRKILDPQTGEPKAEARSNPTLE